MKSRIVPKNCSECDTILSVIRLFFGRIKDIIVCFRDLLIFSKVQKYGKRTKHLKNKKQGTNRRKNGFFRLLEAPLAPHVGSELKNEQRINAIQSLTVS